MTKKTDLLVDTNVLIYYFKDNTDFHKTSVSIIENEDYNLFITTKNISELFAVFTKQKVAWDKILLFFEDLKQNFTILYPNKKSLHVFKDLYDSLKPHGNQVFDLEIVSIILTNNIYTIATFNHKDFRDINEITILDECK
ncbi:MAG: hypothetical protein B6I20_04680 [Bacteroidetes bacterium 4572_117]|nr:MAG: hypothetical protein B6I20_04680 [Bacteroidetes bacterium 4572_117]